MELRWNDEYREIAHKAIETHFGSAQGITLLFPYMKTDFQSKKLPDYMDARPILKTVLEYHGLEKHAKQYHVTGQYASSYDHWIIAACWRNAIMKAHELYDKGHFDAIDFALKNAEFNKALTDWQQGKLVLPSPEEFGLTEDKIALQDGQAQREIDEAMTKDLFNKNSK